MKSEALLKLDRYSDFSSPIAATIADFDDTSGESLPSWHNEAMKNQSLVDSPSTRDGSSLFCMGNSPSTSNGSRRISPVRVDSDDKTLGGVLSAPCTDQNLVPLTSNPDTKALCDKSLDTVHVETLDIESAVSSSKDDKAIVPINPPSGETSFLNDIEDDVDNHDDHRGRDTPSYMAVDEDEHELEYDRMNWSHPTQLYRGYYGYRHGLQFHPRWARQQWGQWHASKENRVDWRSGPPDSSMALLEAEPTGVGAGLSNLGNSCFMNAILQCFVHTVPLVKALRSSTHASPCGSNGFCILSALCHQVELSLEFSGRVIRPLKIFDNLNNISSCFLKYRQEDAHEFLQCLLDRLERCCLNTDSSGESPCSQVDNMVQRIFGGRLLSKLRCCNCGKSSDKNEPLIDLSLEIETVDTLQDALKSFTNVEKIEDPETKLVCDNCNEVSSREKQLLLDQAPSIATFHLKRFKTDGPSVEKIGKHVDFPLQLNLKPYTIETAEDDVDLKYQLYAFVVHSGTSPTFGHYTCYIRSSPKTWYMLDDSTVVELEENVALSKEAYILFYARNGTPWFSTLMETQKDFVNTSNSPKSILENMDGESASPHSGSCAAHIDSCEADVTTDAAEKMLEKVQINETRDEAEENYAQTVGSEQYEVNLCCDESKADNKMGVSLPLGESDCHDGMHSDLHFEENIYNQGADNEFGRNGLNPTSKISSPCVSSGGMPEAKHHIPRDHLKVKVENHVISRSSRKINRSDNFKVKEDICAVGKSPREIAKSLEEKKAAYRLLKVMPSSKRMKLMAALSPKDDKRRYKSSPYKKASPIGSRRRFGHHVQDCQERPVKRCREREHLDSTKRKCLFQGV